MKRRDIEARLSLYDDLSGILGAMRSFALAELHRIQQRETAQQAVVQSVECALQTLAAVLPPASSSRGEVWLLFGSARGFCGSFNEDIARTWRAAVGRDTPTVAVGERLVSLLNDAEALWPVAGAVGGCDVLPTLDRLLSALRQAQQAHPHHNGLIACWRDKDGAHQQRLLPWSAPPNVCTALPYTHGAAAPIAAQLAEHALLHRLLALLLCAIRSENHLRLTQMESALNHLERNRETLQLQRNRLRQEEIINEIEIMAGRLGNKRRG